MPRKLLLLANRRVFRDLRDHGTLPPSVLGDATDFDPSDPALEDVEIQRKDPGLLIPLVTEDTERVDAGDEEELDELFAELLGSTVCHLVVLENKPDIQETMTGPEQVRLQGPTNFPGLIRWYDKFAKEAKRRVRHRSDEYGHVLVLVCADEIPAEDLSAFNRLMAAEGDDRIFDVCYVMLRKLEAGKNDVFFSRYVWPIAVSSLLLRIMSDTPNEGTKTRAMAWRAFELTANVDERLIDRMFFEGMATAYGELTAATSATGEKWNEAVFNPPEVQIEDVSIPDKNIPEISEHNFWHAYPIADETDDVAKPERWENDLREFGKKFGLNLSAEVIEEEPAPWKEVRHVWSGVHNNAANIFKALSSRDLVSGPDTKHQLDQMTAQWDRIIACGQERQQMIEDARECAPVIEEAQHSYVEILFRFIFGAASAVLVAYVAGCVFHSFFPGWVAPSLLAGGVAAGMALVAVMLPMLLERRAGIRAVNRFRSDLSNIDRKMAEQHKRCQESVVAAHGFWKKLRARGSAQRLSLLLRRLKLIIENELQSSTPGVVLSGEEDDDDDAVWETRDRRKRRQRLAWSRQLCLKHSEPFDEPDPDELNGVIRDLIDQFHSVWSGFCLEFDKNNAGNLPAHSLIPKLRDYCDMFRERITREIHRQAIKGIKEEGVKDWVNRIRDLHKKDYFYYMSCPLSGDDIDPSHLMSLYLLRPDFREAFERVAVNLQPDPQAIDELQEMPMAGYFFQEVPVSFTESDEGMIEVKRLGST